MLEIVDDPALLRGVRELGATLREALLALDGVREVRGRGLMLGVGLEEGIDAAAVGADLLERGLVVNVPEPGTLRLLPPLILDAEQAERAVGLIRDSLLDGALSYGTRWPPRNCRQPPPEAKSPSASPRSSTPPSGPRSASSTTPRRRRSATSRRPGRGPTGSSPSGCARRRTGSKARDAGGEEPRLRAVEPPPRRRGRGRARRTNGGSAAARLLATQMAVSGSSREEIEMRLRDGFEIEDTSEILDAILGPEE